MPNFMQTTRGAGAFAADFCAKQTGEAPVLGPLTRARLGRCLAALYAVEPSRELPDRIDAIVSRIEKARR